VYVLASAVALLGGPIMVGVASGLVTGGNLRIRAAAALVSGAGMSLSGFGAHLAVGALHLTDRPGSSAEANENVGLFRLTLTTVFLFGSLFGGFL
jgi:hypothetical protein